MLYVVYCHPRLFFSLVLSVVCHLGFDVNVERGKVHLIYLSFAAGLILYAVFPAGVILLIVSFQGRLL